MSARARVRAATADHASLFVPVAEVPRYEPPAATIDPDRSKTWLRRAIPIVKAHKAMFVTSLVLSFVGLVLQVQIPQILQQAIDNSILPTLANKAGHPAAPLGHYVWWVVTLGIIGGAAGYVSRLFLFQTAYRIEYDLRNIIYHHLTRMSFPFYDRVQSGQLISRANSDIRSVQMYMTFAPSILVQCSIAAIAFAYMLSIDVTLALVAMATMPFVYLVSTRMRRSMFPVSWIIQSRLADVATIVDENINGVRVVRSFAAEPEQVSALTRAAERVQWSYIKDADIRARWTPAVQNLPQVGLALVLLFGGYMVIHGHLQIGQILQFNFYLLMLQAPFMMLGMLIMMGQRAAASAGRIYEILDEPPTITDRPGAVDLVDCRGDVDFDTVSFAYNPPSPPTGSDPDAAADGDGHTRSSADADVGGQNGSPTSRPGSPLHTNARPATTVLHGFELHVPAGQTVALVGRTGSGKSTVARLVARFYDVTDGAVRVDGHDVRDLTLASLRAQVGVVLDEPFLFSVSIRDNIAYGRPTADIADVEAAARAAAADAFIRQLPNGYDTVVGERGYTLSGGQRQRIAIARTLLMNPPILIFDDATSAIDVQVEQEIHSALVGLMENRTTIIIGHRLSTITLAERVVLIDGGRIVADGTHAQLLATTPLYAEILAQADHDGTPGEDGVGGPRDGDGGF
jgi:ATP-binding cassette subfamily B protein